MAKDEKTTVCLVGKSPNIVGKGLGSLIDSHDIVVRMNTNSRSGEFHGRYSARDYGTITNHIHTHPYIGMRHSLGASSKVLKNLTCSTHNESSRKRLFVVLQDESWWTYPHNGRLSGIECGEFSVRDKEKNFQKLEKICEEFDVDLEARYFEPEAKIITDLMVKFNPSKKFLSHGLLTGTETILYYTNRFENVSIAGFLNDNDPVINKMGGVLEQLEYDCFILNQLLKLRLIKRLEDIEI
tara:strand:- start:94 stop:813 length:720 start_codon:yes stop_codon:yes gene_type:complete